MRCQHLLLTFSLLIVPILAASSRTGEAPVRQEEVFTGTIGIEEVSGIAALPGGRLAFVSDEKDTLFVLDDAFQKLAKPTAELSVTAFSAPVKEGQLGDKKVGFDDLEEAVWDPNGVLYLLCSNS